MEDGHGGNIKKLAETAGCRPSEIHDFSANINPLGPPKCVRKATKRGLLRIEHYPEPWASEFATAVADHHGISPQMVVPGAGSTQLIYALPQVLNTKRMVLPVPCYIDYARAAFRAGLKLRKVQLNENDGFIFDPGKLGKDLRTGDLVVFGRPNNPTGLMVGASEIKAMAGNHGDCFIAVDEAFIEFVGKAADLIEKLPENVVLLRSLTKFYAVPGIRLGYAICEKDLAESLKNYLPPWSLGILAQEVGEALMTDTGQYRERTRHVVDQARRRLYGDLAEIQGLTVYPGKANFLLVRIDRDDTDAVELFDQLLQDRIAIRVCDNYDGLDSRFFRVAVRSEGENDVFLGSLSRAFQEL
ncbi:MAG: threonine-phosphate decarboxylase CobD [Candidatus Brocadiia bacterium]